MDRGHARQHGTEFDPLVAAISVVEFFVHNLSRVWVWVWV
jgi:hypothetical protein